MLNSLYPHLPPSFWTSRSCSCCGQLFTPHDYQTQNYQLTFLEVLKVQDYQLAVKVQLTHQECPCLACQEDNYQITQSVQKT